MPFRPSTPDTRNKASWEKALSASDARAQARKQQTGSELLPMPGTGKPPPSRGEQEKNLLGLGRGQNLGGRQPKQRGG